MRIHRSCESCEYAFQDTSEVRCKKRVPLLELPKKKCTAVFRDNVFKFVVIGTAAVMLGLVFIVAWS